MAAKNRVTYHEENINANTLKLREVLDTMPRFSKDFFRAIEPNTSAKKQEYLMCMISGCFFVF